MTTGTIIFLVIALMYYWFAHDHNIDGGDIFLLVLAIEFKPVRILLGIVMVIFILKKRLQ